MVILSKTTLGRTSAKSVGVSCIITCHNYGRFLEACVASCLAQTRPFECIVIVDDASTDDTRDRALRLVSLAAGRSGPRILCVSGNWCNFSTARNVGYAALPRPTPLVMFLDADDLLPPDYVATMSEPFVDKRVGIAYPGMEPFNSDTGKSLGPSRLPVEFDHAKLRRGNFICAAMMLRREAFEAAGLWPDCNIGTLSIGRTDWMLALSIDSIGAWKIVFVPAVALLYRKHPESMQARRSEAEKHTPLVMARSQRLCAVTLFSGKTRSLWIYRRWLKRIGWHKDFCTVLAVDNSRDEKFHRALKHVLSRSGWNFSVVRSDIQPADITPAVMADSAALRKANIYAMSRHVARLYAIARQSMPASTDLVLSVEDDTEPPAGFDLSLAGALLVNPKAGMATGCQRSRFDDGGWILWRAGKRVEPPQFGSVDPVGWTGFYCAMFRRDVFDAIVFRPSRDYSDSHCAYDFAACDDVREAGHEIVAVGDVRCQHWKSDGTCS